MCPIYFGYIYKRKFILSLFCIIKTDIAIITIVIAYSNKIYIIRQNSPDSKSWLICVRDVSILGDQFIFAFLEILVIARRCITSSAVLNGNTHRTADHFYLSGW